MARGKKRNVGRREFLKGVAAGAGTLAGASALTGASALAASVDTLSGASPLAAKAAAAATAPAPRGMPFPPAVEGDPPPSAEVLTVDRTGSDFMVDVLKALGFEYVCAVAGSSFRALHESVINYGGNKNPEFLTCLHEEQSVAMAHGFAKIEGKPLCILAHGTVGLQHASMAIYNAYCDRVPVYLVIANNLDATMRSPVYGEWTHSVLDAAAMLRDYTKWDDQPLSLQHFAESAVRAYKIAMTPPMAPVLLVADSELQENPIPEGTRLSIPKVTLPAPPQGDSGAVGETARLLVQAENPVIVVDRTARTQAGINHLVELAETLQAAVIDINGRMNFPTRHPLNQSNRRGAVVSNADVILGLEALDLWSVVNSFHDQVRRSSRPIMKPGAKLVSISAGDLYTKANYQEFNRFTEVDLAIAADAEATLPALIEETKRRITPERKRMFQDRGAKLAAAHNVALEAAREEAAYGWDASPVSTARLSAELWAQIKTDDWSLVSIIHHFSWCRFGFGISRRATSTSAGREAEA